MSRAFRIEVAKDYFNFASAHFLIFADGEREPLHGHNYQVSVTMEGELDRAGVVLDFITFKPVVRPAPPFKCASAPRKSKCGIGNKKSSCHGKTSFCFLSSTRAPSFSPSTSPNRSGARCAASFPILGCVLSRSASKKRAASAAIIGENSSGAMSAARSRFKVGNKQEPLTLNLEL
jgi:hypothetical protein